MPENIDQEKEIDANPDWIGHYSAETVTAAWEAFHHVIRTSPERRDVVDRALDVHVLAAIKAAVDDPYVGIEPEAFLTELAARGFAVVPRR